MAEATFKTYKISATYVGDAPAPWTAADAKREPNYNNHRVSVYNSATGKRTSFMFWQSIAHPEMRTRADVLSAFECFLSDSISGLQSFDDFCGDFGYDIDSRAAERTWKACRRSAAKAARLIGDDDIYDLANALREAL
jgi:hypothetical protein